MTRRSCLILFWICCQLFVDLAGRASPALLQCRDFPLDTSSGLCLRKCSLRASACARVKHLQFYRFPNSSSSVSGGSSRRCCDDAMLMCLRRCSWFKLDLFSICCLYFVITVSCGFLHFPGIVRRATLRCSAESTKLDDLQLPPHQLVFQTIGEIVALSVETYTYNACHFKIEISCVLLQLHSQIFGLCFRPPHLLSKFGGSFDRESNL